VRLFAVEVLSPSTEHVHRGRTRILYRDKGRAEYWIVDADVRTVERSRMDDLPVETLAERPQCHWIRTASLLSTSRLVG
jgi:Uma2 family endonuclease